MSNLINDKKIKFLSFSKYLFKIGFINNNNINDFQKMFLNFINLQENNIEINKNFVFQEIISNYIANFLNCIDFERKKIIGITLYTKYLEEYIKNKKIFINLIKKYIYSKYCKQFFIKLKNYQQFLFHNNQTSSTQMKSATTRINNNKNTKFVKKRNLSKKDFSNFNSIISQKDISFNKDYVKKKYKKKESNNEQSTSSILKELEELKHCTFKPKINSNYSTNNLSLNSINNKKFSERLYNDNLKRKTKLEIENIKKNSMLSKNLTFKPKLISNKPKNLIYNFNDNLKYSQIKKENNIKKLNNDIENELNSVFTFSPYLIKRNNSFSTTKMRSISSEKSINVYDRLYDEYFDRKKRFEKKNKLIRNKIRQMSNPNINKYNLLNKENNNNDLSINNNNMYHQNKIEELYNDYKTLNHKKEQLKENLLIEQGFTFYPKNFTNQKYFDKINNDFEHREIDLLVNKQKFLDAYNNYLNQPPIMYKKKYTKEEKELITNNIINKLYKEGVKNYIIKKNESEQIDNINNKILS